MTGISSRHGSQKMDQNTRRTFLFPFSAERLNGAPSVSLTLKSGAAAPTSSILIPSIIGMPLETGVIDLSSDRAGSVRKTSMTVQRMKSRAVFPWKHILVRPPELLDEVVPRIGHNYRLIEPQGIEEQPAWLADRHRDLPPVAPRGSAL